MHKSGIFTHVVRGANPLCCLPAETVTELSQTESGWSAWLRPQKKEEPMIEAGIVLLLAAVLTGVFVVDRISKGRHARQNDDLRLHVIKRENRQNS